MPVEELLRRSMRDVADRIDPQPPTWPPRRHVTLDDADEHRVGIRVLAAVGAICLVIMAGVGLWLIRTNPGGSVPADGVPAAPGPSSVGNTLVTTVGSSVPVTNASVPPTTTVSPTTTVPTSAAGSSGIPILTLPPDVVADRIPDDGSITLRDASATLPVLATARVASDVTFDPAVGGVPIALQVSADEVCFRRIEASGSGGQICSTLSDPRVVEGRLTEPAGSPAVEVLVVDQSVQVTSVPGSCTFSLVGSDAANGLDLWACATTGTATVEVDLQAPAAAVVRTYIDGGLPDGLPS